MSNVVLINNIIASKILNIRNKQVILDSDVAELYGVETKHINQAISRNIDKFPEGYVITLNKIEWDMVKSQIVTSPNLFGGGKVKTPKVFTEKGLYMLATILKSSEATATTIAIIETFAAVREIKREVISVFKAADQEKQPTKIINRIGKLVGDLIIPEDNDLETITVESEAEFKFMGILKLTKRTIQKPKK